MRRRLRPCRACSASTFGTLDYALDLDLADDERGLLLRPPA